MNKNWKIEFKKLENAENWDPALELLLKVIEENPDEKDAYILCNHLKYQMFFIYFITIFTNHI